MLLCRCPWNQPDQRTLRQTAGDYNAGDVAVLGTNLINGHARDPRTTNLRGLVAVLGTNLINGHIFSRIILIVQISGRCPWNQPDQRTRVLRRGKGCADPGRCPWNQPDQRTRWHPPHHQTSRSSLSLEPT